MTTAIYPGVYMQPRRKEILCLSQDRHMLQIRRMLLEHFGYLVLSAASAEDAIEMAKNYCPDMLLMDNSDGNIDIEQLARQAKSVCPEMIVAVLSSYYYMPQASEENAIDRVVTKDDGPATVIRQIAELFGHAAQGKGSV